MLPDLLFALLVLGASANMTSENAVDTGPARDIQRGSRPCSMDALCPAAKRRMISEYNRRKSDEGEAKANAWAMEEGNRFRRQLVAEGVCPPLAAEGSQPAAAKSPTASRLCATARARPARMSAWRIG
ncbi:hypothetical protein [Sphingomonas psychrotolerans]|uniref:Uncharacterized protein n=1 Tax=Sphingomonas psychrotolerans TaxID=1327635 RepID=A0A2K8MJS5_9SPHN|nr:hypothetical protein [Sphingomonas psychrotolerans]ATY34113.1 hypothetical protein CVN68_20920 [Sphingomonas psychrotolerans]